VCSSDLALLAACPGLEVTRLDAGWPEGPRTNYEAKYVRAGRPILRLEARLAGAPGLAPGALAELAVAVAGPGGEE
jgi:hypothetical protein